MGVGLQKIKPRIWNEGAHNVLIVIEGDGKVKWEGKAKDSVGFWERKVRFSKVYKD